MNAHGIESRRASHLDCECRQRKWLREGSGGSGNRKRAEGNRGSQDMRGAQAGVFMGDGAGQARALRRSSVGLTIVSSDGHREAYRQYRPALPK